MIWSIVNKKPHVYKIHVVLVRNNFNLELILFNTNMTEQRELLIESIANEANWILKSFLRGVIKNINHTTTWKQLLGMEQTLVCFLSQSKNSRTAWKKGGKEKKPERKEKRASKRPHNQYIIYLVCAKQSPVYNTFPDPDSLIFGFTDRNPPPLSPRWKVQN